MSQRAEPAAQPKRISTLDDVAEIFATRSLELRTSLLQIIASQPEKALRYRSDQDGLDLIDLLLSEMRGSGGYDYRLLILNALRGMPADERIVRAYSGWMTGDCHIDAFKLMLSHLANYPFASMQDVLLPHLLSGAVSHVNLLTLAAALQGAPELTPRQRLRIATLTGKPYNCPSYREHKHPWMEAFGGIFADQAHEVFEVQGEDARSDLLEDFETLPFNSQRWLLIWQRETSRAAFQNLLIRALSADIALAEAALLKYEHDVSTDVLLERFRNSANPDVRAAAIRSGLVVDEREVMESQEVEEATPKRSERSLAG